ncbi:MAG TPA: sigma-70 family RNA polymerase sigma factor [Ghiorsea sp.]|nr:sigma-70 family RNA polymerase sigma factor [Ghiorsea sp.]HIP07344.1 sigma-70 family RNA polymerase sigma factor [Mariprofundaceae bacterium]
MTKTNNDQLPIPVAGKAKSVARYRSDELSPLDMWYRELRQIEKLGREEEAELTKKWTEDKDLQAAQRLLLGNLHAVAAIAREYRHFGLPEMDLIQEGTIGLMKAIHRFDPSRGFRLMTYASWWVRAAIHDYILKSWSIVKMGTNKMQRRIFSGLKKAKHAIAAIEGRLDEEVANEYGITGSEFQNIASSFLQRDMSLDSESEEGTSMVMALPSPDLHPEEQVINADWKSHQSNQLHDAMSHLSDRDRLIITRRHLSEEPDTLKDLAGELGISIERVRQLEARAMKKLRATMT